MAAALGLLEKGHPEKASLDVAMEADFAEWAISLQGQVLILGMVCRSILCPFLNLSKGKWPMIR